MMNKKEVIATLVEVHACNLDTALEIVPNSVKGQYEYGIITELELLIKANEILSNELMKFEI